MERAIVEIVARVIITIKSCRSTEMYRHSSSALMLNTRIVFELDKSYPQDPTFSVALTIEN